MLSVTVLHETNLYVNLLTAYYATSLGHNSLALLHAVSLSWASLPFQIHHHVALFATAMGQTSICTSPCCTLRHWTGSHLFYKYITILYFTSLPGVTILLQVHHHTILYVSARGHNPPTSTSPYCTLRLCPGSQSFYKYITILYFTSLPGVTIHLQVHHHTVLYVSARGHNPSTTTSPYCSFVSARGHNPFTSASPCCALRFCPRSQSFYKYITILCFTSLPGFTILHKYITILYYTSLPGVIIPQQVHHHTVLNVSSRVHKPFINTSPYCTLRLCPGSQSLHKYITILYLTSLPVSQTFYKFRTILYLTSLPRSQSVYKCITILYFTSLPGVKILPQVNHHTVLYVSARGHNPSTTTSPCCILRLCPGSQSFYKCITMLYFTSLPRVTIILQVHHGNVLYVSARVQNHSTSISRYCTLRLSPGS